MNADAYLRKQGWQGSGHSLDSIGRGIKKPLLISHKQDQLGLGKKKTAYTTDDQWWMRAYDQSLQSIGTGKESTLNQIRTQGINRGGLYGFFVKGEAIAGTIDDSSTTDTSIPPSGASTPPTSPFNAEVPAHKTAMSGTEKKRKRADKDALGVSKKKKPSHKESTAELKPAQEVPRAKATSNEQAAVDAKLAKMKPEVTADYETRAAAKNQTIEQYVLRRIQKKTDKRATEYAEPAPGPPLFFADLEGDPNLVQIAKPVQSVSNTQLPNNKRSKSRNTPKTDSLDAPTQPKKKALREPEIVHQDVPAEAHNNDDKDGDSGDDGEEDDDDEDDEKTTKVDGYIALTAQPDSVTSVVPYTPLPDGSCPIDPKIWDGHQVSTLPKAVRKARRLHLAEKRLARKMTKAGGKKTKLSRLTKTEQKLLDNMTPEGQIQGVKADCQPHWGKTKEMRREARKAKKLLKQAAKKERKGGKGKKYKSE